METNFIKYKGEKSVSCMHVNIQENLHHSSDVN